MEISWITVEGHRVARMLGPTVTASVDVDRGAHIFELVDLGSGTNVLYRDPRGLVDHVVGGWYSLFPNAGPACVVGGRPIPRHGDVRNLAWDVLDEIATASACGLRVHVTSQCLPLALTRTILLTDSTLEVSEVVTNEGDTTQTYLLGHHITFGSPFVDGARIEVPSDDVVSRDEFAPPPSVVVAGDVGHPLGSLPGTSGHLDLTTFPPAPAAEMLFARTLEAPYFEVRARDGLTFRATWDPTAFPALWIWIENRGTQAQPFGGTCAGLALEPQSSHIPSLRAAAEANLAPILGPGEMRTSWVRASLFRRPPTTGTPTTEGSAFADDV